MYTENCPKLTFIESINFSKLKFFTEKGNWLNNTILIVDDDPDTVLLVKRLLDREGYQVLSTEDGKQALQMIHAEKPRIVLLDIKLPQMDGCEVCEKIKSTEAYRDTVIIVLMAKAFAWDRERAFQAGADYYMTKPFSLKKLVALVQKIFSHFQKIIK